MGIVSSAVGGVFNLIGSAINNRAEKKRAQEDREWNSAEAEKARQFNAEQAELSRDWQTEEREATQDWNLEQWNRENEYNSPAEQLKRAMEAGINPNSAIQGILGHSQSGEVRTSPQSGAQASGPAASGKMSMAPTIGQLLGQSVNSFWQNQLMEAQVRNTDQDTDNKGQEYHNIIEARKGMIQARKNMEEEFKKLGFEADMAKEQLDFFRDVKDDQLLIIKQTYTNLQAEHQIQTQTKENLQKEGELLDQQKDINQGIIAQNAAETALAQAQTGLVEAQTGVAESTKTGIDSDNSLKSKVVEVKKAMFDTYGWAPDDDQIAFLLKAAEKGVDLSEYFTNVERYRNATQFINNGYNFFSLGMTNMKGNNVGIRGQYKSPQYNSFGGQNPVTGR